MARPSPWLMSPALIAGTWLLSAQSPPSDAQIAALEKRVADLEALISKTGTSTQIKGPLIVVGSDGRPILEVVNSSNLTSPGSGSGAVVVARHPGLGGGAYVMDEAGKSKVALGISGDGFGFVGTFSKAGKNGTQISGQPAIAVWDPAGNPVAGIGVTPEGTGRFSILNNRQARLVVIQDSGGAGHVSLSKSDGQSVAQLGVGATGSGRLAVMNAEGKVGAAMLGNGIVATAGKSGQTLAQLGVTPEGVGSVQIFSPNGVAMAVMSQGGNGNGGIFQVLAGAAVKATFGTGYGGGGMLQLVSSSGTPTVEAGTMQSGRGIVRVGPFWKCSPIQASTPVMSMGHGDCLVGSLDAK